MTLPFCIVENYVNMVCPVGTRQAKFVMQHFNVRAVGINWNRKTFVGDFTRRRLLLVYWNTEEHEKCNIYNLVYETQESEVWNLVDANIFVFIN